MSSSEMNRMPSIGLSDMLRIKMQLLDLENRQALKADAFRTAQVNFNLLLNRAAEESVLLPDTLIAAEFHLNRLSIMDSILLKNPMFRMSREEEQAYTYRMEMADKMSLPMFGIGAQYMLVDKRPDLTSADNGMDMIMPMLSLTIPVYRGKYKAQENEALYLQKSASHAIIEVQNQLIIRNQQLLEKMDEAWRRIDLSKLNVILAKQIAGLLIKEYSASDTNIEDVLQAQLKVLEYRLNLVQAVVDYNMAVAETEQLIADF